jgi:cytoskeletal protein CcmA (bactofilin family)
VTVDGEASGAGPWKIAGEHRFGGAVTLQSLDAQGRVDVGGALTATQAVSVIGTLDVLGDVQAGSVAWRGAAAISGEIRATSVTITTIGPSKVGSIRAPTVHIEHKGGRFASNPSTLEVLEIEGKEVHVAGVVAQLVKADRIIVGPGCRLAEVDGTVVSRDPSSHIGPQSQSPKPYGLSR